MDKKALRLYYIYFIPITILQSLTSLVAMSVLTVNDYGLFVLYLSALNFFFFLTFGIQNGYTLLVKEKVITHRITAKLSNLIALIYLGLIVVTLPVLILLKIELYWKLAFISGALNALYIFHKSVFRTEMKIHSLNIYTLLFRLIALIDIGVYLISKDITTLLYTDVVLRGLLVLIGSFVVALEFKSKSSTTCSEIKNVGNQLIRVGIPIMLGNWLITIYSILDKTFLASHKHELGLYSFAITIVLLVRVILIPISELYFVTLNEQETAENYYKKVNYMRKIANVIVVISAILAYFAMNTLGLFNKYLEALPVLLILLNILPLSTSLDIYIYNYSKRENGHKFLVLASISAFITLAVLYSYTSLFQLNLLVYSYLVYLTYLIVYLIFIKIKLPWSLTIKLLLKNIVFLIFYGVFCFYILI